MVLNGENQEVFTAAGTSGSTNFEVQYDLVCRDGTKIGMDYGKITLKGSVPSSPFESNKFSCAHESSTIRCNAAHMEGYHVEGVANIELVTPVSSDWGKPPPVQAEPGPGSE